jgi:hypothetical protein
MAEALAAEVLAELLAAPSMQRLAIAGLAKNVGKTTLLGAVAARLQAAGGPVGFVSIGVDGERVDGLSGAAKPPVLLAEGDLAVTAERSLGEAECGPELLSRLGVRSVLGELFLVRATRSGRLVLAGVRFRSDVALAVEALRAAGAARVLIDGAFDRLMGASPGLCDGVLLATGMAVSERAETVAQRTAEVVARFGLPVASEGWWRGAGEGGLVGWRAGAVVGLDAPSLLSDEASAALRAAAVERLYAPGAFSERAAALLLSLGEARPREVVVADATHVMVSEAMRQRLARAGVALAVARAVPLLAVAYNPVRPEGGPVVGCQLLEALSSSLPEGTPLWDVVAGRVDFAGR